MTQQLPEQAHAAIISVTARRGLLSHHAVLFQVKQYPNLLSMYG